MKLKKISNKTNILIKIQIMFFLFNKGDKSTESILDSEPYLNPRLISDVHLKIKHEITVRNSLSNLGKGTYCS